MITIFGTSLATSAPWLLLAIPIATSILIYTFRARGQGAPTVTSSLFLLSKLPLYLPARKSFLPPIQFWLELAAFLLLSLAAAGLTASSVGERIAIVVDSSTSMSALTSPQSTRLEAAKRLAQADVATSLSATHFAVFSADTSLRPISDGAVSSARATESLTSIAQTRSPDALATALSSILSDATYDGIWVYTDKKREDSQESARVRVSTIPLDPAFAHNLWIHSATVADIERQPYLRVEVFSSDDKSARPTINATCESKTSQGSFTLSSVSSVVTKHQPATINLAPLNPSWSYCSLSLSSDPRDAADAISLDNSGYVVNNPSAGSIVVMSELPPTALGLSQLSNYTFIPDAPAVKAGSVKTIFHRVVPKTIPSSSALVALPPKGPLPWKGGEVLAPPQTGAMEISRWAETHPIARYTQPQLLSFPSSRVLVCPDSATAVLHSQYGALLCAGEEGGNRYVIVGFELFPFDGIKSPTLSVLTLNILNWLFHAETLGTQNSALSTKLLNDRTLVERLTPDPLQIPLNERLEALEHPGVFKLTVPADGDTSAELYASNSFVDEESDIGRERTLAISTQSARTATSDSEEYPLERALAIAALLILLIDLARRLRRPAQWGSI